MVTHLASQEDPGVQATVVLVDIVGQMAKYYTYW